MDENYEDFIQFNPMGEIEPKLYFKGDRGWNDVNWISIDYCPFCGEKIDCVEVKRVRIERKKEIVTKKVCKTISEYEVEIPKDD